MKTLSYFVLSIGILSLLMSSLLFWQRLNPSRLSFDVTFPQKKQEKILAKPPKRILIPRIHVDVPIVSSEIKKGEWETTQNGISYLHISPIPGETGNSILYGHNFENLFGKLPMVTAGDVIEIVYADNTKKEFVIHYTQIVTPKQIDIIKPTTDTRLTLYTCTGFLDSKRFVAVAMPKT